MKVMIENKFNPFKAKSLQFVTYGGLSLNKQRGYDSRMDSFHKPPSKKGIYSFVWPYVEKFLLGGTYAYPKNRGKGQRNRISYVRDKDGEIITTNHPEWEKHSNIERNCSITVVPYDEENHQEGIWALYRNTNRKKFSYKGTLWHHLDQHVPEHLVLDRMGSWVKTDIDTFHSALKKELHSMSKEDFKLGDGKPVRGSIKSSSASLDHLEVFIDEKI